MVCKNPNFFSKKIEGIFRSFFFSFKIWMKSFSLPYLHIIYSDYVGDVFLVLELWWYNITFPIKIDVDVDDCLCKSEHLNNWLMEFDSTRILAGQPGWYLIMQPVFAVMAVSDPLSSNFHNLHIWALLFFIQSAYIYAFSFFIQSV